MECVHPKDAGRADARTAGSNQGNSCLLPGHLSHKVGFPHPGFLEDLIQLQTGRAGLEKANCYSQQRGQCHLKYSRFQLSPSLASLQRSQNARGLWHCCVLPDTIMSITIIYTIHRSESFETGFLYTSKPPKKVCSGYIYLCVLVGFKSLTFCLLTYIG